MSFKLLRNILLIEDKTERLEKFKAWEDSYVLNIRAHRVTSNMDFTHFAGRRDDLIHIDKDMARREMFRYVCASNVLAVTDYTREDGSVVITGKLTVLKNRCEEDKNMWYAIVINKKSGLREILYEFPCDSKENAMSLEESERYSAAVDAAQVVPADWGYPPKC